MLSESGTLTNDGEVRLHLEEKIEICVDVLTGAKFSN